MATSSKRAYRSTSRPEGANRTRAKVLEAGRHLFSRKGIDATTIAQIAERAGVSEATVYATVGSKSGLLDALMREALFGPRFKSAQDKLEGVADPVQRIALTAHIARAIYQAESAELSLLMKASAFSPELRKSQQEFETLRRDMQRERIDALFKAGRARKGLTKETAATLMWMFTGREIYHKLVHESGWTPDRFQDWLERTLLESLTDTVTPAERSLS
ncbi:TetR/AcrR family transcriptional regulator [Caenimonas soli]|uniref:TetR/AcrR family transcriptional regulator n=1 Tax=Caenimonas soli TaxID=2735555 RepID=UPI001557B3BF|nr:TetR/AcrR family transcriptional regulator [Caenimonas soli]NPC58091.1 TetR/AcrR family transcriptional regulator [Caenimonas soli]